MFKITKKEEEVGTKGFNDENFAINGRLLLRLYFPNPTQK